MIYKITFSPTGGTKKIADLISGAFSGEKAEISLLPEFGEYADCSFFKEDICILAVPSFGGRVPTTAVARIRQLKGNGARAVLVCVYGNRAYEDTLLELKETAESAGFLPVAAIAAIAEHSIMRQFAAGRPDEADAAELRGFARKLAELLENTADGTLEAVQVPGNHPYKEYGGVPFVPKADRSCTGCGHCAKECPVGAIDPGHPRETDKEKCISCMRCIAVCPLHSRGLNKLLLAGAAAKMAKAFEVPRKNEMFVGEK